MGHHHSSPAPAPSPSPSPSPMLASNYANYVAPSYTSPSPAYTTPSPAYVTPYTQPLPAQAQPDRRIKNCYSATTNTYSPCYAQS